MEKIEGSKGLQVGGTLPGRRLVLGRPFLRSSQCQHTLPHVYIRVACPHISPQLRPWAARCHPAGAFSLAAICMVTLSGPGEGFLAAFTCSLSAHAPCLWQEERAVIMTMMLKLRDRFDLLQMKLLGAIAKHRGSVYHLMHCSCRQFIPRQPFSMNCSTLMPLCMQRACSSRHRA